MQIMIDNALFDYNTGCRVLKSKHRDCPFDELKEFWDSIEPLEFKEVAALTNMEARRVALLYLGIESILEQANAKILVADTIAKTTQWVAEDGSLVTHNFDDRYELWTVSNDVLLGSRNTGWSYFVRMKDTSTDRQYLIWIDYQDVIRNSIPEFKATWDTMNNGDYDSRVGPIACIAWTIQTNVPVGKIKSIIRQGDCILVEPTDDFVQELRKDYDPKLGPFVYPERHLTEAEYRKYLILES